METSRMNLVLEFNAELAQFAVWFEDDIIGTGEAASEAMEQAAQQILEWGFEAVAS